MDPIKVDDSDFAKPIPEVSDADFASSSVPIEVDDSHFSPDISLKVPESEQSKTNTGATYHTGEYGQSVLNTLSRLYHYVVPNSPEEVYASHPVTKAYHAAGAIIKAVQEGPGRNAGNAILQAYKSRPQVNLSYGLAGAPHNESQAPVIQNKEYPSLFTDPRPTKEQPADFSEMLMRQMLTTLSGNDIGLTESEALPAINSDKGSDLGRAAKLFGADLVGGVPVLFWNPGGKLVAGERAALQAKVAAGEIVPEAASAVARRLAVSEARTTGAVVGAAQDAKEGKDPGLNTVFGAVLGHLSAGLSSDFGGANREVMSYVNAARTKLTRSGKAVVAPYETWSEFVKQAEQKRNSAPSVSPELEQKLRDNETKRQIETDDNTAAYYRNQLDKPRSKSPDISQSRKATNTKETPTYKTVELDHKGDIWEVGYKVRLSTQVVTEVASRKLTNTDFELMKAKAKANPQSPMPSYIEPFGADAKAYAKLTDIIMPAAKEHLQMSDGDAAFQLDQAELRKFLDTPKEKLDGPPTQPIRIAQPAENKVLINHNDGVVQVPVAEEEIALAPTKVRHGDFVKINDETVFVNTVNIKKGIATVEHPATGAKSTVSVHEISPLPETQIKPDAFAKPSKSGYSSLLRMKKLTVQRIMKAMDSLNPGNAASILTDMTNAGQVTHDGNGNYFVKESYKPEPVDRSADIGMQVYFGKPVDGFAKEGILRGPDPKKPGNWIVEIVQSNVGPRTQSQTNAASQLGVQPHDVAVTTYKKSIDPATMRLVRPALYGNAQLAKLPQQLGITRPIPPGIAVVLPHAQVGINNWSKSAEGLAKLWHLPTAIKEKMAYALFNDAFKIPTEIQPIARKLFAGPKQVEAMANAGTAHLADVLGGVKSKADTGFVSVLKARASSGGGKPSPQELAMADFFQKHPELDADVQDMLKTAAAELKFDQEWLAKNNVQIGKLEAARAAGLAEEYLTNSYARNMMRRKDWAKFVSKQMPEVWEAAINKLTENKIGGNFQDTIAQMADIMQIGENEGAMAKQDPNGNVAKKLIKRKVIEDTFKKLLGDVESAAVQFAQSKATARGLRNHIEAFNNLAASDYWSPGPRVDLGPSGGIEVPNNPIYGKAAGGRLHESLKPLLDKKVIDNSSQGLLRAIGSYWKFNVVPAGGLAPWVNNVMRNWKGMVLSGGLDELGDFQTFFHAAEQMLNYKKNPLLYGPNKEFIESMENQAVSSGFASNEIYKNRTADNILKAILKQQGKQNDMFGLLHELRDTIKGGAQDIGAAYDAIDRLFKFTAYLNIKRRGMASGLSADEAAGVAVLKINDSFPNYEMVSGLVEKWRKNAFGTFAPFLSAKAEDMRINMSLPGRLLKEPDLRGRLLQASMIMSGAYFYMKEMRRANGIDDKTAASGKDTATLNKQAYSTLDWIGPTLDSQKRMQRFDMTTWEDAAMQCRIHPLDDSIGQTTASILRNNMVDVYGQDSAQGQFIDRAISQAVDLHPLINNNPAPSLKPGETSAIQFMTWLASQGAVPQFPNKIIDIYRKGQPNPNPSKGNATGSMDSRTTSNETRWIALC
jgi:hypothetical protein